MLDLWEQIMQNKNTPANRREMQAKHNRGLRWLWVNSFPNRAERRKKVQVVAEDKKEKENV